jgi:Maltose acetyltransferase
MKVYWIQTVDDREHHDAHDVDAPELHADRKHAQDKCDQWNEAFPDDRPLATVIELEVIEPPKPDDKSLTDFLTSGRKR